MGTTNSVGVNTADTNGRLDQGSKERVRGIASGSKNRTPAQNTAMQVTEIVQSPAQLSNTPSADISVDVAQDAYRFGNSDSSGDDPLINSRVLGEADDKIATISLSSDTNLSEESAGGDVVTAYSRFFLQAVSESQVEKFQIVETFTAFYTFFYGKRPPVYSFRGTLLNDENHKWTNDLMFFYENFFRGTRSAELNTQAVISYDGRLVSGFILNLNIQQSAEMNKGATFSMDVLITDHQQVKFSADIDALINSARASLEELAVQIQQQISVVKRSIPTGKTLTTLQTVQGKLPFNNPRSAGKTVVAQPVSQSARAQSASGHRLGSGPIPAV
jgi:hypothetical protein